MATKDNNTSPSIASCSRFGLALLLLSTTINAPTVSSFALVPGQSSAMRRATESPSLSTTTQCQMTAKSSSSSSLSSSDNKKTSSSLSSSDNKKTEIQKQVERAKAAVAASRAILEAQDQAADDLEEAKENDGDETKESLPFFASATAETKNGKKEKVMKKKNEDGLFTTDGDLMAKLSEEETWERRPLMEVFKDEKEKGPVSKNVDRDIGQSMYNLRKKLQTDDFLRIFDKKNHFIGEP